MLIFKFIEKWKQHVLSRVWDFEQYFSSCPYSTLILGLMTSSWINWKNSKPKISSCRDTNHWHFCQQASSFSMRSKGKPDTRRIVGYPLTPWALPLSGGEREQDTASKTRSWFPPPVFRTPLFLRGLRTLVLDLDSTAVINNSSPSPCWGLGWTAMFLKRNRIFHKE